MKKELVVKDNALINASYHLTLVEQRLILLAIIESREGSKVINAHDPLTIRAERYARQFGVERQAAYMALKDACEHLFERRFSYQKLTKEGNLGIVKSRWVSRICYVDAEAAVSLIFAPDVVPLITKLEKRFTSYELEQVSQLTSAYAIRLYELLIAWRSKGETPIFILAEFRNRLGVLDGEHPRSDNFKKIVLNTAVNQINQHTDITATYAQHKEGRVIVGFSFQFKQKKLKSTKAAKSTSKDMVNKKPGKTASESLRSKLEKSGLVL
jgi:plasmid replication initiation protein